ncbi:MAG TPA: copper homeostasis protein CutC [Flavobacterium sp.]|uniref:copper homeostasis protein CutC n=1 Tax=unclassified Flavobacterium TaxID=196869 RepID=UPI000E8158A8|nr:MULTISPECIES: copper homeostasis protein CutC [unclassified Flavobacterium]HBI01765.1 copper homeostasis protein CutC [Flavobacterium sp.]HRE77426.1 copper homeostasis protein CutC [Flavobacterium sp.]
MSKLEIACFNAESATIAQNANADRVELCDGIEVGGTTPNLETVKEVRQKLTIDLYVMIRPRGGNFVYCEEEIGQMKSSIVEMKKLGVDGFVFGILNEDNSINKQKNIELIELTKPYPCTFHRAFDEVLDYEQALEDVIECRFSTILTSGTKPNVTEGIQLLKQLVEKASNRITIMPGGGLRSSNISELNQIVKADFYHSSAIIDGNGMADITEIQALKSKLNG